MRTRKLKRMLREGYGKVPDATYFEGDMSSIRAYYDYRRDRGLDPFLIDEITWNDLDMDRVFQRINPRRSSSGEQYLYYMLRSPALDEESFQRRRALIEYAQRDPERRLRAELILARLGCTRRADLCRSFDPEEHGLSPARLSHLFSAPDCGGGLDGAQPRRRRLGRHGRDLSQLCRT